jgi:hypothetical protein
MDNSPSSSGAPVTVEQPSLQPRDAVERWVAAAAVMTTLIKLLAVKLWLLLHLRNIFGLPASALLLVVAAAFSLGYWAASGELRPDPEWCEKRQRLAVRLWYSEAFSEYWRSWIPQVY